MDTVFIRNYTVEAKHGYYKEEHAKKQRFIVSVTAYCDTKTAGGTDDLRETINYEVLRKYIYDVLMKSPHNLLESLAEEIASLSLTHNIHSVEVEITKPDVWNDCMPGIKIIRQREL